MQATMTVRTDAQLKATFTQLCEEFGMSVNTAMNIFMRAVAETKTIPFTIGKKRDAEADYLKEMLERNRQAMIVRDEPEMSLDEINAEIAAARAERKVRKAMDSTGSPTNEAATI